MLYLCLKQCNILSIKNNHFECSCSIWTLFRLDFSLDWQFSDLLEAFEDITMQFATGQLFAMPTIIFNIKKEKAKRINKTSEGVQSLNEWVVCFRKVPQADSEEWEGSVRNMRKKDIG